MRGVNAGSLVVVIGVMLGVFLGFRWVGGRWDFFGRLGGRESSVEGGG